MDFQQMVLTLQKFWSEQDCILAQPYDMEKGAGTMNPLTFLRVLGPEPWRVAYVEPSRRPADGRYGDNPNRLFQHHQYQVIIKPSPANIQDLHIRRLGIGLGSLAGRYGNHPVYLFPAGRQSGYQTGCRGNHVRPGTDRHVHPGRGKCV